MIIIHNEPKYEINPVVKKIISIIFGAFIGITLFVFPTWMFSSRLIPIGMRLSDTIMIYNLSNPRLLLFISGTIWSIVGAFVSWGKIYNHLKKKLLSINNFNSAVFYIVLVIFIFVYRYLLQFIVMIYQGPTK